jgi:hypothetical protein
MNGILFPRMRALSRVESKLGHEIQLMAALVKLEALHRRILPNQSMERSSKAAPACMEIHRQLRKATGNGVHAGPRGEFLIHGHPFGSYTSLVGCQDDFAFVSEVLVKRSRKVAGFRRDMVGVGGVVSSMVQQFRRVYYQALSSARGLASQWPRIGQLLFPASRYAGLPQRRFQLSSEYRRTRDEGNHH